MTELNSIHPLLILFLLDKYMRIPFLATYLGPQKISPVPPKLHVVKQINADVEVNTTIQAKKAM